MGGVALAPRLESDNIMMASYLAAQNDGQQPAGAAVQAGTLFPPPIGPS
jgi:hypothetical protein